MNLIYVCNDCGSPDVEIKKWVNLNTNIPITDVDDECFCNNCDTTTEYKMLEVNDKEKKRLFKELYSNFIEEYGRMKELARNTYNMI